MMLGRVYSAGSDWGVILIFVAAALLAMVAVGQAIEPPEVAMTTREPVVVVERVLSKMVLRGFDEATYWDSIVQETQVHGVPLDLSNDHAKREHGIVDVFRVRHAMLTHAETDSTWFDRPPCKDGRFRYVLGLDDGSFAIWVLDAVAGGGLREVTAFITRDQNYVNQVREQCGGDDWFGHVYAGE